MFKSEKRTWKKQRKTRTNRKKGEKEGNNGGGIGKQQVKNNEKRKSLSQKETEGQESNDMEKTDEARGQREVTRNSDG